MYDLIIIGAGPAGLTASIYASCFYLRSLVIGGVLGGQMINAPDILNYPGFKEISGKELTDRMAEQVKKRGGELLVDSVVNITRLPTDPATSKNFAEVGKNFSAHLPNSPHPLRGIGSNTVGVLEKLTFPQNSQVPNVSSGFELETQSGKKYQSRAIILATGTERRKLNVPGEVEYTARGVHYCATCERFDYDGKICGVVGGGNSAVQAAVQLAQAAKQVYIIYRGSELRGEGVWLEQIKKNKRIEVIYQTTVTEITGDGNKVTSVTLNSKFKIQNAQPKADQPRAEKLQLKSQNERNNFYRLPIDKLFIEIGGVPGTALAIPIGVEMNESGYIKVDDKLQTNVPGIFAAGDLVSYGHSIEQISTAIGLGARAAASAFAYLKGSKAPTLWGESQIKR